jgi:hypothetical protein
MIHDLNNLGLIPFRELAFHPSAGCEFYITLGRAGTGPTPTRLEMLKQIKAELVVSTSFWNLLIAKIKRKIANLKKRSECACG